MRKPELDENPAMLRKGLLLSLTMFGLTACGGEPTVLESGQSLQFQLDETCAQSTLRVHNPTDAATRLTWLLDEVEQDEVVMPGDNQIELSFDRPVVQANLLVWTGPEAPNLAVEGDCVSLPELQRP